MDYYGKRRFQAIIKNEDFMEENKRLKQNIDELKNRINELEGELGIITNENQTLNNKVKQYENEIGRIKKDKNKLYKELQSQDLSKEINQYKEKEINYKNEIQLLNNDIQNFQKESKFNLKEKENLSKDPLEFYDIIGNINSIQNVSTDGWNFYMNEEGFKIDQSKDIAERLVIGVMGNRNKGKSFILQALSGACLKTGTTINTIGISIKYLENKYVLLDCAGSESPLLGEYTNMLEISRDKLFTEAFLERYILRKSNVLLLVVGILTFSEQKLINKISQDLEKLKEKEKKDLVVIHNLQTYESVADVEKYINETLLKSASFKIKRDESNFGDNKETSEFFYDIDNTSVKHFIYARENSEAGNKYNVNTINSIKSLYKIIYNNVLLEINKENALEINPLSLKNTEICKENDIELTQNKFAFFTEKAKHNMMKMVLPIKLKTTLREFVQRNTFPLLIKYLKEIAQSTKN